MTAQDRNPAISVVVCAYNSRRRIGRALDSLRAQDLAEPFEVVVVASGTDGCAEMLAARYPEVRVIWDPERILPGPARNAGVQAARGAFVAFLPDDGIACTGWLRHRLEKHREGFLAVGGGIGNGTPTSPIGSAGYYVEYPGLLPIQGILESQETPHCLSYDRQLIGDLGWFPVGTRTGEDTLFNQRLSRAGIRVAYMAKAEVAHLNLSGLGPFLRHQYSHGIGLVDCAQHGFAPPFRLKAKPARRFFEIFVRYPVWRAVGTLRLLARFAPARLFPYLALMPLVAAGYISGSLGVWHRVKTASS